jgi:hypothetical protein
LLKSSTDDLKSSTVGGGWLMHRRFLRGLGQTVLLLLLVLSSAARADDRGKAAARQSFHTAMQHYALAEWEAALKDFTEAFRAYEEPVFLFNIAQCHRQLGHHQEAVTFYRSYLRSLPEARNREEVRELIVKLETTMAEASAAQKMPPQGPREPNLPPIIGTTPLPPPAPAVAPPPPAPRPNPPDLAPGRSLKRAGLGLGVGGVVLIGVGGAFAGLAVSADHDLNHPPRGTIWSPSRQSKVDTDWKLAGTFLGAGGAALVAGVAVFVTGWQHQRHAVAVVPSLAPNQAGIATSVQF